MMASGSIERVLSETRPLRNGVFVAVVGPSGSGKDTILAYARERLQHRSEFHFVRRIVTRAAADDTEEHDTVNEEAFDAALEKGAFSLHWNAHGLRYALPKAVDHHVDNGAVVIANVSRSTLEEIGSAYANIRVIHLHAAPEVLARRLAQRGREDAADIEERLRRGTQAIAHRDGAIMLDNSGPLEVAGDRFVAILEKAAAFAAVCGEI
ncbi:phosphonate metabolism protein/1,5-bisphosphokinase (PRPP-forming) PhnN [Phyllobacterium leguminum]|uniref:Ribose 1,5-bisphosphate phosphokinase PhnN n=1 Tax=Phyllobacterium leguminum TaxID=314237 RepID=A0A318TAE9_9HYPH|nr:phosphonate metabolism protein/1,5-bisphosphokinase (PRPP-forming) PhnN [Phyllobacterium leguminum]PYE90006.1 ribose 1,5-bisphosphokinase [Phyllobacterium leguminum]